MHIFNKKNLLMSFICAALLQNMQASIFWSWGQLPLYKPIKQTRMWPNEYALTSSLGNTPELAAEVGWRNADYQHPLSIFTISLEESFGNDTYSNSPPKVEPGRKKGVSRIAVLNNTLTGARASFHNSHDQIKNFFSDYIKELQTAETFQSACFFCHNISISSLIPNRLSLLNFLEYAFKKNFLINYSPHSPEHKPIYVNGDIQALNYLQKEYNININKIRNQDICVVVNKNSKYIISYKNAKDDDSQFVLYNEQNDLLFLNREKIDQIEFVLLATSDFWQHWSNAELSLDDLRLFIYQKIAENKSFSIGDELVTFLHASERNLLEEKQTSAVNIAHLNVTYENRQLKDKGDPENLAYHVAIIYPNAKSGLPFNPEQTINN